MVLRKQHSAGALRGLIHAANTARDKDVAAVPDSGMAADLSLFRNSLFRNAVRVGLSEVRPVRGAKSKQKPGRMLLECLKYREADVLRFLGDLRIPPTSNQAERDLARRKPSRRSTAVSAPRPPPATGAQWRIGVTRALLALVDAPRPGPGGPRQSTPRGRV